MIKIAIITLNYNGKKNTLELLESLTKLQTTNYQLQTIVVDNASSDGSVTAIHKQFPKVDVLQTGENLGFAGGFNKGLQHAKLFETDYFLLINNDCLIKDENLLLELIKTIKSDSKIGLVSPKIYFAPGFEFHKDRYQKEDLGKVIWYGGGQFDWNNIGAIHHGIDEVDIGQYNEVQETGFISGACVLIKKEVLEKVGLLNEEYFLYLEDADFVKKVKDAGFKIYYNGETAIYHKVSQTTGIGSNLTDYYHTRNRLIFGMKYGSNRTKFALLREAVRLLIFGRPAQRKGVLDFYLGIRGGANVTHLEGGNIQYPFKLSIGIVNYNTADLTKQLLQSIFSKNSGFDGDTMEVIVLDNGLQDSCQDFIKDFKVKYLQNKENQGFAKGYNQTIKYSLGEYYLMLNSDIRVLDGGLSELVKAEDELKGQAVLGGKLVFGDLRQQDSAFNLPTITGAFKEYFLGQKGSYFMFDPTSPGRCQFIPPSRWYKVEGLVMACFLIPKKVIKKVGLLDEGTFIFFEDIEYCRRLKQFNVPVYFVPKAKFIHYHGSSTAKVGFEKSYQQLKKAAEYYHGKFYYFFLNLILILGQKFGRVKTPRAKWIEEENPEVGS